MLRPDLKIKIKVWVSKSYTAYPVVRDIVDYLSQSKLPIKTFSKGYIFHFKEKDLQFVLSSLERLNLYPEVSPKIVAYPNTELPAIKDKLEAYIVKNANKVPSGETSPVVYFRILIKVPNRKRRQQVMNVVFAIEREELF